jgi:class I fructose-bisphosphate aldolase
MTEAVRRILSYYDSDTPGTKANLYRILMHGKLGGTGRLLILPVDQGFEHGPTRSFAKNPPAYDPHYHYKLAINAGLNAYAAPLGFLEAGAGVFAGQIPTILKLNSNNSLIPKDSEPNQAMTASPHDALRLGCAAVGLTIYPGSHQSLEMIEKAREVIEIAKSLGLVVVAWCYPRGSALSKEGETAIDVTAYAAHMACLLGAHIIKVKLPTEYIEQVEAAKIYEAQNINISTLDVRVRHIVEACFNGKRLVVFSGGVAKNKEGILEDASAIRSGGGSGFIIGRNSFQRQYEDAIALLDQVSDVLK